MSAQIQVIDQISRPAPEGPGVTINGERVAAVGGAYEGADRLGRQLASWAPKISSADGALGRGEKLILDGRGHDVLRNNGNMQNASFIHQDSIVGSHFRLNSKPNLRILGLDDKWSEEFQAEVEAKWMAYAEADLDCWSDTTRRMTFTDQIRLAIGCFFAGGEVLGTADWLRNRPMRSAFRFVDADRLSNPQDAQDTNLLRRGVEFSRLGEAVAVHIRTSHPRESGLLSPDYSWQRVPMRLRWGRGQVLHILRHRRPSQSRGISDMVAVLKETRMAKTFHEVSLENAIVQATYAAAIESELPANLAFESIGGQSSPDFLAPSMEMLSAIAAYSRGGKNLEIDGVKIPYLFPGSKLKLMPAGTVGGVGQDFEESLNRYISAGVNISYEEYTHDYTKTNYSSAKAASNSMRRFMMSQKRMVADRAANFIYSNWLEEMITEGKLDSMPNNAPDFYEGFNKYAYCQATWIGSSLGQVDEMKETQAAIMRINNNMSTYEIECARLGSDFRDVFAQTAKENALRKSLGIENVGGATKPGTLNTQRTNPDETASDEGMDNDASARGFDDGFGDLL